MHSSFFLLKYLNFLFQILKQQNLKFKNIKFLTFSLPVKPFIFEEIKLMINLKEACDYDKQDNQNASQEKYYITSIFDTTWKKKFFK